MSTFVDNSKNIKTSDFGKKECSVKDVKAYTPEAMYHLAFIGKTRIVLCNGLEGTWISSVN